MREILFIQMDLRKINMKWKAVDRVKRKTLRLELLAKEG